MGTTKPSHPSFAVLLFTFSHGQFLFSFWKTYFFIFVLYFYFRFERHIYGFQGFFWETCLGYLLISFDFVKDGRYFVLLLLLIRNIRFPFHWQYSILLSRTLISSFGLEIFRHMMFGKQTELNMSTLFKRWQIC